MQGWFDEQAAKLDRWEMLLKFEIENLYSGQYTINTDEEGYTELDIDRPATDNPYSKHEFEPGPALQTVTRARNKLQDAFFHTALRYFADTYDVTYENEPEEMIPTFYKWEVLIDYIFSAIKSPSLADHILQEMKDGIRKHMQDGNCKVIKNVVQFDKLYIWMFDKSNKEFKNLFTALGYFETGELGHYLLGDIKDNTYKQIQTYDLKGAKAKSIHFYRTDKIAITFADNTAAHEFYKLF